MKAIVTVVGQDRVGIIAAVCTLLADHNINILDISQTILQGYFTMVMAVDTGAASAALGELRPQLEELGAQSTPDEFYSADRTLHKLLAHYCGNSRLQKFLNTLDSQIERVRYISARRPDRLPESKREHLDIIHALKQHNLDLAEEKLVKHIQNVGESTKQVCRLQQSRSPFPTVSASETEKGGWTSG